MEKTEHCCESMQSTVQNGEPDIVYIDKFREYGIRYRDGGSSFQLIYFCPWCGKSLPVSLRDQWFDELERRGIDTLTADVPPEFESSIWWKKLYL